MSGKLMTQSAPMPVKFFRADRASRPFVAKKGENWLPLAELDGLLAADELLAYDLAYLGRSYFEGFDHWAQHGGADVRVAVLDSGVDLGHPALKDAVVEHKTFVPGDDDAQDMDGHGTHCAGIIGGRPTNGSGPFSGIAPRTELVIGKIFPDDPRAGADANVIAKAIVWAAQRADIISLSLSSPVSSAALFDAVHAAVAQGKIIICAAGNQGMVRNRLGYPARYGSVITVGAHDAHGEPVRFSSCGGEIDFGGLGENVWSTFVQKGEHGYARLSGTSMAAPFVAGIAALILSKHRHQEDNGTPIENIEDMKEHLMRIAARPNSHDDRLGYGPLWPLDIYQAG